MNARVFYNEIDPFAADWLEQLIAARAIPAGVVDRRDIRDIAPRDLDGFDQCHFFAGIGGWALAMQLVGWPDDRPVWTGSCPCQPFSAAGRGGGFVDERHLWPAFFHLIGECRPATVFGEQVASKDGLGWLDLVHADLEGAGCAVGAADLCAAGVGAPHIRQRLWWVADAGCSGLRGGQSRSVEGETRAREGEARERQRLRSDAEHGGSRGSDAMADAAEPRWSVQSIGPARAHGRPAPELGRLRDAGAMGDAVRERRHCGNGRAVSGTPSGHPCPPSNEGYGNAPADTGTHDRWRDLEWLPCRDGKARPTKPGLQPLAHGVPNRVGTLRGAGNAIVPQVAVEIIRAFL